MNHLLTSAIFILCAFLALQGCRHHHRTSVAISESGTKFTIVASFDQRLTTKIDRCMNRYLTGRNNMSFVNTRIDGQLTLDDKTTFYINKHPGVLEIEFNKSDNPSHSYDQIKALGEGLKAEIK